MTGKRKFVSEFSIGMTSKGWLIFTPDQLHSDGRMKEEHQNIADNSHIYLICKRPKAICSKEMLLINDGILSGEVISRVNGEEVISTYSFPFKFESGEESIVVADYPHKKIHTLGSDGKWIRYWPSDFLALYTKNEIYHDLEVLYVGQAFAEGKRTAMDRLRSHSTLQKILADTMCDFPDDQIFIVTLEYDDYILASSFNSMDKSSIGGQEDDGRGGV